MNKSLVMKTVLCILVLACFSFQSVQAQQSREMPVFKVKTSAFDDNRAQSIFESMFSREKFEIVESPYRTDELIMRDGKRQLEFDKRSGYWYAADKSKLWNSQIKGEIPKREIAVEIANKFVEGLELLPSSKMLQYKQVAVAETAIGEDGDDLKKRRILDFTVTWSAFISIDGKPLPVVGGGSEVAVTVGVNGDVTNFMGGWRPIAEKVDSVEISNSQDVIKDYLEKMSENKQEYKDLKAQLAYYAAPAFEKQEYLAPVWVVSGNLVNGKEVIPFRPQIIAATKYGPVFKTGKQSEKRDPSDAKVQQLEQPIQRGDEEGTSKVGFLDSIITPAYAAGGLECGASWIGTSQGLSGSSGNRQGFIDECRDANWSINFDWGDAAAWESDWRRNDDSYVDGADIVFYTGHASQNGWNVLNPDDTFLNFSEVSGASDMWGQQDLEWVIVAACGPLQSTHFMSNTTSAFSRWRDAFDGLHVFLAYGAVTYDNTSEGRRFMELALSGDDVIDAWFRTAREIQPATNSYSAPNGPNIYVTAMYAHDGDHCTENDHLHGAGSVCPDVRGSSQRRTLMWAGT